MSLKNENRKRQKPHEKWLKQKIMLRLFMPRIALCNFIFKVRKISQYVILKDIFSKIKKILFDVFYLPK
jgi:hypothetical protein